MQSSEDQAGQMYYYLLWIVAYMNDTPQACVRMIQIPRILLDLEEKRHNSNLLITVSAK